MKPPKGYRLLRVGSIPREDDIRYSFDWDSTDDPWNRQTKWGKPDSWDMSFIGKKLTSLSYPWARKIKRRKKA